MSFQCELSGEVIATNASDEVVVTPSGHICIKRLLLTKLTENGGKDPFHEDRPLLEDQLVTLASSSAKIVPPRPNATSSMPGLLNALQTEYDALVLELFDTRKALEETRRELSQALYQNDAAMRVVARVAMERDQAQQQLEQWKASSSAAGGATTATGPVTIDADHPSGTEGTGGSRPASKKRKIDDVGGDDLVLPLANDIPAQDFDAMLKAWETLHKGRKAAQKEAGAVAPSKQDIAEYKETATEAWHQTTCKGVTAMAVHGSKIVSTGKDKSILVYDTTSKQVTMSLQSESKAATCVDMNGTHIAAGTSNGKVLLWKASEGGEAVGVCDLGTSGFVLSVHLHPDGEHVLATSEKGVASLIRIESMQAVSRFSDNDKEVVYTAGAMHPDGLIFVAGSESGDALLWDFKSKKLAATLNDDAEKTAVVNVQVSNNGYHIAVAYASGKVRVFDMRKQKCLAVLNESGDTLLETVSFVAFDPAGKYVAYSGTGGVRIVTVKDWNSVTASLDSEKVASGVAWGQGWLVASSSQQRKIQFFGKPGDD